MHPGPRTPVALAALSFTTLAGLRPAHAQTGGAVNGLTATMRRADAATEEQVSGWLGALTSGWSPNRGQMADESGRPVPDVLYRASLRDAQVYVTVSGLTHVFFSRRRAAGESDEEQGPQPGMKREPERRTYDWSRLEIGPSTAAWARPPRQAFRS